MYNKLSMSERFVYMVIKDSANDDGFVTMSIEDIRKECCELVNFSKKKTYFIVKKLLENGLISIVSIGTGKTKTTYELKRETDLKQIDYR